MAFHRFSHGLLHLRSHKATNRNPPAETYHIYRFLFDAARLMCSIIWALLMWHAPQSECAMTMTLSPQPVDIHKAAYNAAESGWENSARHSLSSSYITVLYAPELLAAIRSGVGVHTGKDGDFSYRDIYCDIISYHPYSLQTGRLLYSKNIFCRQQYNSVPYFEEQI